MNWQFSESHILTETQTGFVICLLSGSWSGVEEIKPIAPTTMSFLEQATLLREGLDFAESHDNVLPLYEVVELNGYQYQYKYAV